MYAHLEVLVQHFTEGVLTSLVTQYASDELVLQGHQAFPAALPWRRSRRPPIPVQRRVPATTANR